MVSVGRGLQDRACECGAGHLDRTQRRFIPVLFRDHFLCFKAMIIRRAESRYILQNWATSRTANSCVRRMRSIPCA
jgi:hypothetical protein